MLERHLGPPGGLPEGTVEGIAEQPAVIEVLLSEIDGDPHNVRDSLPNVDRLAESIYRFGLLENLVAVEVPEALRRDGKWLELRAGSRRFEALRRLIEDGVKARGVDGKLTWPADRKIPVLVLGTDGNWEHLVENVQRMDLEPWEIGRRLSEAFSSGMSARDIGGRIGRSNGWVTRYIQIGTGLDPKTIEFIRERRLQVKIGELFQLSQIHDEFGDPDPEAQILEVQRRRQRKRRPRIRRDAKGMRSYLTRLTHLRAQMGVPPLCRPIVAAVIDYLDGGQPPPFRQLSENLFSEVKRFAPEEDS